MNGNNWIPIVASFIVIIGAIASLAFSYGVLNQRTQGIRADVDTLQLYAKLNADAFNQINLNLVTITQLVVALDARLTRLDDEVEKIENREMEKDK